VLKERGAGKIGLFVTHGIFSRGLDIVFNSGISDVFTTDSFEQKDPRVQIIHKFFPTEQEMQFLKHL
jgi:phosphoribosylpyrophosphate synthetase